MKSAPLKKECIGMVISPWLIKPISGSPAQSYPLADVAVPSR